MTSRERAAYAAGIIDGEGCISVVKATGRKLWRVEVCVTRRIRLLFHHESGSLGDE